MSPPRSRARPGTDMAGVLRRTLGTPGLVIAGLSILMFLFGLVIVRHEYNRLGHARKETMERLIGRWVRTASGDYLGSRNLVDDAQAWRREPGGPSRAAVADRLNRMGDWFEQQNERSPIVEIIELWLRKAEGRGTSEVVHWQARTGTTADSTLLEAIPVLPATPEWPGVVLDVRYRTEPEVARMTSELETSYRRLLLAVLGLSGYSVLCLIYMGFHAHALHASASREAAQQATIDLADRTCHELGNVAFVLSNERRNLSDHLALVERFLDEQADALEAAIRRARLDGPTAGRLRHALRREYAERAIDPDLELRGGASIARDVCRQIAVCSDYIALTVRELDGYLKQSALPVAPGPVDVVECLDDAQSLLGPSLDAASVRVERPDGVAGHAIARADRRLLVHALVNLLKNAVEATKSAGAPPRISLAARAEGPTIWVEVGDNGPGIAPDVLPRIFDVGYSTKGVGRGRGLAIVKDSIAAQGGSLHIESEPGRGTTFRIGLPRASEPSIAEGANPAPTQVSKGVERS
jgi:signal transduction histidine kinase